MRMRTTQLGTVAILVSIGASLGQTTSTTNPTQPKEEAGNVVAGLQLTVDRAGQGIVEITFQNIDTKPMFLNLGIMLGNGRSMFPLQLRLIVTAASGESHQLEIGRPRVAGRIDDLIVPLMPNAKYTVTLSISDFSDLKDGVYKASITAGEKVQAVYEGAAPSHPNRPAIPDLPIWNDKVESAPVSYVE